MRGLISHTRTPMYRSPRKPEREPVSTTVHRHSRKLTIQAARHSARRSTRKPIRKNGMAATRVEASVLGSPPKLVIPTARSIPCANMIWPE